MIVGAIALTWYIPGAEHFVPKWLEDWMYPIDKTNLDVLRFAHFIALAVLTVRLCPQDVPAFDLAAADDTLVAIEEAPIKAGIDFLPAGERGKE